MKNLHWLTFIFFSFGQIYEGIFRNTSLIIAFIFILLFWVICSLFNKKIEDWVEKDYIDKD